MRIPDRAKRMVYFRGFVVSAALEELGSGTGRGSCNRRGPWRSKRDKSLEECGLWSEADAARDLQKSGIFILRGDLAFCGIPYHGVGRSKLHTVEEVESFHSKIKRGPLEGELLIHRHIVVRYARLAQSIVRARFIAEGEGSWSRKAGEIEIRALGSGNTQAVWHGATGLFRTPGSGVRAQGALKRVGRKYVRSDRKTQWEAFLEGDNTVESPSADQAIRQSGQIREIHLSLSDWEVLEKADHQPLARIEAGKRVIAHGDVVVLITR